MTRHAVDIAAIPFHPNWSAQDIADAVPLRLCEIVRFDLAQQAPANRSGPRRRWREHYAPRVESRPFRIQG